MNYFVYFEHSCCANGDHDVGLESFGTEEEALAFADHKRSWNDAYILIIQGYSLAQGPPDGQ